MIKGLMSKKKYDFLLKQHNIDVNLTIHTPYLLSKPVSYKDLLATAAATTAGETTKAL